MIRNGLPYVYDATLVTPQQWVFILDLTLKHGLRDGHGMEAAFWRVPTAKVSTVMQLGESSEIDRQLTFALDKWVEGALRVCTVQLTDSIIDFWPMISSQMKELQTETYSLLLLATEI